MADWYYMYNGQQTGPVSGTQLKSLAATGSLGPEDLVWNEAMKDWVAAGRVRGLMFAKPASAPAVARPAPAPIQSAPAYAPQPAEAPAEEAPPPYEEEYAPAPQEAPAQYEAPVQQAPQALAYSSSGGQEVSDATVKYLRQTRPWVLLISILMFLGVAGLAIMAVLGFVAVVAGGALMSKSASMSTGAGMGPMPPGGMRVTSSGSGAVPMAAGASIVGLGLFLAIFMLVYAALVFFPAMFLMKYAGAIGRLVSSSRMSDLDAAMKAQKNYWMFVGIVALVGIGLYVVTFFIGIAGALH